MTNTVRVAAVQFATGVDVEDNLQTCLRLIDKASEDNPDILVMPEFCNHSSWYKDQDYAYEVAVDLDGFFTQAIAEKAKEHGMYIMLNCTVRREKPTVTGTNILFDPSGEMIAVSDKQVLMGNENNFLSKATKNCPIIETPLGKIGMYSCMDGVIFETPRGLAVRGAQILLNSLNSFASDEGSLHVPVRAGENKVFIVAANKVGSLVPEELASIISERVKISPEQLHGAGESQIVAPDGTVLAIAPEQGEAVVFADIDPSVADNKLRPDGTDIMATRRPNLYKPLAQKPSERNYQAGAESVSVAVYAPEKEGEGAVAEVVSILDNLDVSLLVLPELFHIPNRIVIDGQSAETQSKSMMNTLVEALKKQNSDLLISTSIVSSNGTAHTGVILSQEGVMFEQQQLHQNAFHADWQTQFGDELKVYDSAFGRMAIAVGNDSIYPELLRLMAIHDVEIVLAPTHITEVWEVQTGLLERAAENRMNILVASRPTDAGSNRILAIDEDFTLWAEWKKRPFDGNINYPIVRQSVTNLLLGDIYPASAGNRFVSQKTDVVDGRPYWLLEALITE